MDASNTIWRYQNRLLALLADATLARILPLLSLQEVQHREILAPQGDAIRFIDFPCNCVYSSILELKDNHSVEVGTVGNEGIAGLQTLLDAHVATSTLVCQIPGTALRMRIEDFQREIHQTPDLRLIVNLYAQAYLAQMEQSVACNKSHHLEQRIARWLLMTHDRVGKDEFPFTQESLATMLGVYRPTVSLLARKFQCAGALDYSRGRMRIRNRELLETASCECYASSRRHFERLLGTGIG